MTPKLREGYEEIMRYLEQMSRKYPEKLTRKERFHQRKKKVSKG